MENERKKYTKLKIGIYEKEVFAEYGYDNHELIEESLVYTVYSLAETKPIRENLELVFTKNVDTSFEEERFKQAYKNTITNKTKSLDHEIRRCAMVGIFTLIVGLLLLCVDVFLIGNNSKYFYELVSIFAWVFCWVATEVLTIQILQLVIEKRKYKRLLRCKITFKD